MKCFYKENNTVGSNHQHVVCAFYSVCYVLGVVGYIQDVGCKHLGVLL
jgi:hypothetical protein